MRFILRRAAVRMMLNGQLAGGEAGGVEFLLNVEWPTPLNVMVTITVLDEIDQFVIV
jgi:hypothetical protein